MEDSADAAGSVETPQAPAADTAEELAPREPWHEGPDEAPEESWLALDDDALLHRIETGSDDADDEQLLQVVASARHFFIRQEAAKRIRDRRLLFAFEEDRHVGQILVRHLNRREDLTYLERLAARSRHVEVRTAAQVQLARVWRKLEAPRPAPQPLDPDLESQEFLTDAAALAAAPAPPSPGDEPSEPDPVDASLLGWAAHFVVEHAWGHLGTTATRELLRRTRGELLAEHAWLAAFDVTDDSHVAARPQPGGRFPRRAIQDLAAWMTAFRAAARAVAPDVQATSIRGCTALMADALREAGFYAACDTAEARRR